MPAAVREKTTPLHTLMNAGRHPAAHVALGLALAAGAIITAHLVSRRHVAAPDAMEMDYDPLDHAPLKPPPALLGVLWPPAFMALTLSGLRIWNAPPSQQRSRALTLWGLAQAFNALWMALGPRRLGGKITTAIATIGASGAYAWEAHRLYSPSHDLYRAPQSWRGFAGAMGDRFMRRRAAPEHTVH
jgi:tryptophan-rich sensory protein